MRFLLALTALVVSFATFAKDIEVPPEIRDVGGIKVVGPTFPPPPEPEPGKPAPPPLNNVYEVCAMTREKSGQLKRYGRDMCTNHKIDDVVQLPPGTFIVFFNNTRTVIEITNEVVVLQLEPVNVVKIDGTFRFNLFVDPQAPEEQTKLLQDIWVGFRRDFRIDTDDCTEKALDGSAQSLCSTVKNAKSPNDLRSTLKFDDQGHIFAKRTYNTDKVSKNGLYWVYTASFPDSGDSIRVGAGHDGDTIWMFPGTYFASWSTNADHKTTERGIDVKAGQGARIQLH